MCQSGLFTICLSLDHDVLDMSKSTSTYYWSHLFTNSRNLVAHLILKPKVVYLRPFLSSLVFSKFWKENFMYFCHNCVSSGNKNTNYRYFVSLLIAKKQICNAKLIDKFGQSALWASERIYRYSISDLLNRRYERLTGSKRVIAGTWIDKFDQNFWFGHLVSRIESVGV